MSRLWFLAIIITVLFVVGCSTKPRVECTKKEDCAPGLTCYAEHCVTLGGTDTADTPDDSIEDDSEEPVDSTTKKDDDSAKKDTDEPAADEDTAGLPDETSDEDTGENPDNTSVEGEDTGADTAGSDTSGTDTATSDTAHDGSDIVPDNADKDAQPDVDVNSGCTDAGVPCDPQEAESVFVDVNNGQDTGNGNKTKPLKTIQKGIAFAKANSKKKMIIAGGNYTETLTISGANILGFYGGYSGYPNWEWNKVLYETRIFSAEATGIYIENSPDITLSHLIIQATDASEPGTSSYGIRAYNSPSLKIENCYIEAGMGASGKHGSAGAAGTPGANGIGGNPGCEREGEFGGLFCSGCAQAPTAGSGGDSLCNRNGGDGGSSNYDNYNGDPGKPGVGAGGGSVPGGISSDLKKDATCKGVKVAGYVANGTSGLPGPKGVNGPGGQAIGGVDSHLYLPASGQDGYLGQDGEGGGGGAGGRGYDEAFICPSFGSSGGGGGAGGCGGKGGTGGQGGGGSFGVFLDTSNLFFLFNTKIVTKGGGAGGEGGTGGQGGTGGAGGAGGQANPDGDQQEDAGCGGWGGDGGAGGKGGYGGGGGGGPSIGIAAHKSTYAQTSNTYEIGEAGKGGVPAEGYAGQDGTKADHTAF